MTCIPSSVYSCWPPNQTLGQIQGVIFVINSNPPIPQPGDPRDLAHRQEILTYLSHLDPITQDRELKRIANAWGISLKALREACQPDPTGTEDAPAHCILDDDAYAPVSAHMVWPGLVRPVSQGLAVEDRLVFPAQIVISARVEDVDGAPEQVIVAWKTHTTWQRATVPRRVIADQRQILSLTEAGCPVTSSSAPWLVRYFAAFELVNRAVMPVHQGTHRLGWKSASDPWEFAWPFEEFGSPYHMHVTDAGAQQVVQALTPHGDPEAMTTLPILIKPFPMVQFALYAAAAAPLLYIVQADNFVVDLAGPTSGGKTTTLKIAASLWGNPSVQNGLVRSWNTTASGIEQIMALLMDLPIFLDESHLVRSRDFLSQTVYEAANGVGRTRATPEGGTRAVGSWRLVLLSSGEQRVVDVGTRGGIQARVITLWGSPFGKNQGPAVRACHDFVHDHYGILGPQWIRWLQDHHADWPRWKARYRLWRDQWMEWVPDSPVSQRLAGSCAITALAGSLMHQAFDWSHTLPTPHDVAQNVFQLQHRETREGTAEQALRIVLEWCGAHLNTAEGLIWDQGRWGLWTPWKKTAESYDQTPTMIYLSVSHLEKLLADHDFPASVILEWRDRQWIRTDTGRKTASLPRDIAARLHIKRAICFPLDQLPETVSIDVLSNG